MSRGALYVIIRGGYDGEEGGVDGRERGRRLWEEPGTRAVGKPAKSEGHNEEDVSGERGRSLRA